MPHEIHTTDQIATRTTPWHGLGVTTGKHMTSAEAIELARLGGWEITLVPLHVTIGGEQVEVPGKYAVVRQDTGKVLGSDIGNPAVVGDRYQIVPNEELFAFADALVDTGEAWYESAGSLRDNTVIFLTMKLDRPVTIADIHYEPYLSVTSSHDGSYAWRAGVSPTIIVCMNTFRLAVEGATYDYTVKHTLNVADRIAQAREALKMSFEYYDGFDAEVQALLDTEITRKRSEELLREVFPDGTSELQGKNAEKRREQVRVMYRTDPAAAPWQGTAWGLLNAINTWELWESPVRASKRADGNGTLRLERQAQDYLLGKDSPYTHQAHKILRKERETRTRFWVSGRKEQEA